VTTAKNPLHKSLIRRACQEAVLVPSPREAGRGVRGEGSRTIRLRLPEDDRATSTPHPCTPLPVVPTGRGDRGVRGVALALLVFACHRQPIQSKQTPPPVRAESPNLIALSRGGSIVSRTAELDLSHSAVRLIDGSGSNGWLTPSGDPAQSIVLSLPARARIDRVGIMTTLLASAARDLRFDFSLDGEHFTRSVTMTGKAQDGIQAIAVVPPVDAQTIRLSTLNARSSYVLIRELIVNGAFLDPPVAGAIDGCWSINDQPATFRSFGASVSGYVGGIDDTTLEGGSDGRFYRFAWTRGKEYGLAAMSVTPDGKHLGSVVWHEQAIEDEQFHANDWLGERGACPPEAKAGADVMITYLQRFGYFPLYALRFADDGTLDDGASAPTLARVTKLLAANPQLHLRFVSHELTHTTSQENLAVAQRKIASLHDALTRRSVDLPRANFVALGEEHPRRQATTDLTRAIYSSVDLELRR
jgi:outer membrane protein OmpA-like peptidoglycan-associated protein